MRFLSFFSFFPFFHQVDEILYFNAILAPKESRAKWRATQVWKECDREIVEKFGILPSMKQATVKPHTKTSTMSSNPNQFQNNIKDSSNTKTNGFTSADTNRMATPGTNDDTEPDEEIEDFEVEPNPNKDSENTKVTASGVSHDSDSEYGLAGEEEVEDDEPLVSALAREEGLHLANDIKFLADEVEEEMERVLGELPKQPSYTEAQTNTNTHRLGTLGDSVISSESTEVRSDSCLMNSNKDKLKSTSSNSDRRNSLVTSSTGVMQNNRHKYATDFKDDSGTSSSLSELNGVSIAVQTVSTGDIMATQLYHEYET